MKRILRILAATGAGLGPCCLGACSSDDATAAGADATDRQVETGGSPSSAGGTSAGGANVGGANVGGANVGGTGAGGTSTGGASVGGMTAGGASTGGTDGEHKPLTARTVFLAGDSTVSAYADTASTKDQAGWGQMLGAHFQELITVDNRAVGGRTARRFIEEGRLDDVWGVIEPGDHLLVQFGTNDSNKSATYTINDQTIPYYLDPSTDFKTYLMQYVDGAKARDAVPVLVTPPPRNSAYCTGGNGTGAYAQAMRELGADEGVLVADSNKRAVNYLKAICPSPAPEDFFLLRADNTVDGTHFQENGARILAGFVALELQANGSLLANYLVD